MPTFSQLVRKGRENKVTKSKSPALQTGYNSRKKVTTNQSSPQKEVFVQLLKLKLLKTKLCTS